MALLDDYISDTTTNKRMYINLPMNEMVELISKWTESIDHKTTRTISCHPVYNPEESEERWDVTITTRKYQ